MYAVANTTISVSSNGLIGLKPVTTAYSNAALPQYAIDADGVFPFWDDLYITQGTPQGIFYAVDGTSPSRGLTFEFYESHYNLSTTYAHFLVSFYENLPNVVTIDYLNITDNGTESKTANLYSSYAYNQAVITNSLMISFNYTSSSWYTGFPPGISAIPGAAYY